MEFQGLWAAKLEKEIVAAGSVWGNKKASGLLHSSIPAHQSL